MRWVCPADIEERLTAAWRAKAQAAADRVAGARTPAIRKEELGKRSSSDVWREFHALLGENLTRKCWYCESEEIRSDMPVDHFRPKGRVHECAEHEGYWWLAFDWMNYRCACTYCNSARTGDDTTGGKHDQFPLLPNSVRAQQPGDDLGLERPALLDPFVPDDHKALWFDADGIPEPSARCNDEQAEKVTNSISVFHLHETRITRKRNELRIAIERDVQELRSALDDDNVGRLNDVKGRLRRRVRDTEKLSRAAVVYLSKHRELPEIREILDIA